MLSFVSLKALSARDGDGETDACFCASVLYAFPYTHRLFVLLTIFVSPLLLRAYILNNVARSYSEHNVLEALLARDEDTELELDHVMATQLSSMSSPGKIAFTRARSGWFSYVEREDLVEGMLAQSQSVS